MIIFCNTDLTEARHIAEQIRQAVEQTVFLEGLQITISGGIKQDGGETLVDLIHFADLNLYKAKKQGKNKTL